MSAGTRSRGRLARRAARLAAVALVIGLGVNHLWWAVADWHLRDMNAYWEAALRLRAGQALYPPLADLTASEVYRYSPWFAWLWVPVSHLPREVANVGWSAVLVGASGWAVEPLLRRRAWLAVAFFLPILIGISAIGNAHALVIAMLVHGVERRSGPLWIGIAASLKLFPLVLALTYAGRREWARAAAAVAISAVLVAPFALYDLSAYPTDPGSAALVPGWPFTYVAVAGAGVVAAVWLARSRWAWLASASAIVLALPRSFLYDVTWVMIGAPARGDRSRPR